MKKKADHYNELFAGLSAEEIIQKTLEMHPENTAFSTSLGAEDQVITHMLMQINSAAKIFTLDTGRLFPETYELIERTEARYGKRIKVFFPDYGAVENMVSTRGINLFYYSIENRKMCCHIRKIEPLQRALKGNKIWITGLRREQSPTRKDMRLAEWDEANRIIKVNPLLEWTEKQVWDYIREHNIPYNSLHDKGFPSIGCQPCTRAIESGEDIRAGRWWWENPDSRECGLHKP
ncbi:MAG: phosphoadenylyl-sulfate reductase [Bacteroides sp.]|jgi:phosphoadenosine phosphosulfate reductase|nr:phosphoadenylyl-sulfate reductase [Bacteroides sp.]